MKFKTLLLLFCFYSTHVTAKSQTSCDSFDVSLVCLTNVGYTISDVTLINASGWGAYIKLDNVTADSVCLFVRDSFNVSTSNITNFEATVVDCSPTLVSSMFSNMDAILYNDLVLFLFGEMEIILQELDTISCVEMEKPYLEFQVNSLKSKLGFIETFRDSIESNVEGNNVDFFAFHKPLNEANIANFYKSADSYISLLSEDTCDRIQNRLGGKVYFLIDDFTRLLFSHREFDRVFSYH